MRNLIYGFATSIRDSVRDLAPIVLVIVFFQYLVLDRPIPNISQLLYGAFMVIVGLSLFIRGLEMGLFPIGESMAYDFVRKGNLAWLLVFAFTLGFGTTIAEPALMAVANEAAKVAADGKLIEAHPSSQAAYALGLRITVAVAVGIAIVIGVIRILMGWPVHYLIISGYLLVLVMTVFAPDSIIGIAYDSGGVATSTVTVPLVTALGIGLAASIKGRNPMVDGFGLIALAALTPIIFVMAYGMIV